MEFADVLGWIEKHPGLASWVQAIGAIAALGLALWIPSRQRLAEREEVERKRKSILLVFLVECELVISITQKDSATLDVRKRLMRELLTGARAAIDTDTNPDSAADCLRLKYNFEGLLFELDVNEVETERWVELTDRTLSRIAVVKEIHCAGIKAETSIGSASREP
jgi:hypothetical protein